MTPESRHRVLVINQYSGSPIHGMEFRPHSLAREWMRAGHAALIVAGAPSHTRAHDPELSGMITSERVEGVDFEWLKLPSYAGNGVRRAANIVAFAALLRWQSRRLARRFRPDIVIASSTHPLDIYGAAAIARRAGARLVFEVHDLWPLTPIELGGVSPRNPFIAAMDRAERYACRHADAVVSILPAADDYLVTRGLLRSRYVHIPNGVSLAAFDAEEEPLPRPHAELLAELRAPGGSSSPTPAPSAWPTRWMTLSAQWPLRRTAACPSSCGGTGQNARRSSSGYRPSRSPMSTCSGASRRILSGPPSRPAMPPTSGGSV